MLLFSTWLLLCASSNLHPLPKHAWEGFGGIGVEMQRRRRTSSRQEEEPCPAYTASKSVPRFILYNSDRSDFDSDTEEEE